MCVPAEWCPGAKIWRRLGIGDKFSCIYPGETVSEHQMRDFSGIKSKFSCIYPKKVILGVQKSTFVGILSRFVSIYPGEPRQGQSLNVNIPKNFYTP